MTGAWSLLALATVLEVAGTLALRMASGATRWWFAPMALCYAGAFAALQLTLARGLPLGVAYGVWAAAGVSLTALASRLLFAEPLTRTMALGIGLIAGGVLLVEFGRL